jgi:hypothetical protein
VYRASSGVSANPANAQFTPKPTPLIAAPTGLNYTTDPATCMNHVGLLGGLVCQQIIAQSGLLLLIWDWSPCSAANCVKTIQGYHIYVASPVHIPSSTGQHNIGVIGASNARVSPVAMAPRTPISTQDDPDFHIRGIHPFHVGECFIVTAYAGSNESPDSNTFCVGGGALVAAPWYIRNVPNVSSCADPAFGQPQGSPGQPGYDMCVKSILRGDLVLEWNWNPCAASAGCTQSIDGYNVYWQGLGLDVQQSNSTVRGADVGGFDLGQCYNITAYRGNKESVQSAPFCVTKDIIPTPTPAPTPKPAPTPPMKVVIHITGDSFPANTYVGKGGTVTWINDDTDEHDVYFDGGFFFQDLPPGESATMTVGWVGPGDYYCHYHQGMRGRITGVSH